MQAWLTDFVEEQSSPVKSQGILLSLRDDFFDQQSCRLARQHYLGNPHNTSTSSSLHGQLGSSMDSINGNLCGMSVNNAARDCCRSRAPGQRIIAYENAMTPSDHGESFGFKAVRRSQPVFRAVQLADFPNEILIHILSYLQPDSQAAVALVSKRFYSLITTPHAWRMAFLRYFLGHESMHLQATENPGAGSRQQGYTDVVRSETRYFARLTALATWRSEYLLRTRLLRCLVRGKPGVGLDSRIGSSTRTNRLSAVLTYNSKLPWAVSNLHVIFPSGTKSLRAVHGSADLGVGTMSDPTLGKIERWGSDDPFMSQQLHEVFADLEPYGVGEGPAANPNVIDVSAYYGILAGEGFPGGRAYYRAIHEKCGRYLGFDPSALGKYADVPDIPELAEAICSVWIAKSSSVPSVTQSMVGMLTGSTLGVVTSYALGCDASGSPFSNGDMTARWVLSPGIPIISLKVDDQYNKQRQSAMRVWVVALNALGEVFYLTQPPIPRLDLAKGKDAINNAWCAGRSVYWRLIDQTRRRPHINAMDKNKTNGIHSTRSMPLNKEQLVADVRETNKLLRLEPSHFRKTCDGWDMRRTLEVDFANDDGASGGEVIIVIESGWEKGAGPSVTRYIRSVSPRVGSPYSSARIPTPHSLQSKTMFGGGGSFGSTSTATATETSPITYIPQGSPVQSPTDRQSDWVVDTLSLLSHQKSEITASALDASLHAVLTHSEDPLWDTDKTSSTDGARSDTAPEIPGRRARLCAVGTKSGSVLIWNVRQPGPLSAPLNPVRVIQTESPEISCLASNGLYLVHGGNDGLVQAWDPLASTQNPLRTLNARASGRVPHHMLTMNPALRNENYSAARAIALDQDPTILRGVVSFGAFLRYWTYSARSQPAGRKRRLRHSDIVGRLSTRRQGGSIAGYIAAETTELRRELEHESRERARLRNRYGVGGLSEEEAIQYAQMISEESYEFEEQRRTSTSDHVSAEDANLETPLSYSESTVSTNTPTPRPTQVPCSLLSQVPVSKEEQEYKLQLQLALRLSLLEGVAGDGSHSGHNESGDYDPPVTHKKNHREMGVDSRLIGPSDGCVSVANTTGSARRKAAMAQKEEDDLAVALHHSIQDRSTMSSSGDVTGIIIDQEEFPPLDVQGKGKGKARV